MERDLELYRLLLLTRAFEQRVGKLHAQNKILGGIYSGRGQEAIAVGGTYGLYRADFVFPLHRDLGVFLAKGVEPRVLMAQLYGKETGLSRGKDSFLHGGQVSVGVYGATSMLGSTLPVACGVALKQKIARGEETNLCVAFFGEGAASRGDAHEAMNFAALWKLPIVFVCENNGYAFSTPFERQTAVESIAERGAAYGMPGRSCDGNSLGEVLEVMERCRERARTGQGPSLVECRTWRLEGHSAHDRAAYRGDARDRAALWEARDPIRQWADYLRRKGIADFDAKERELSEAIYRTIDEAVAYAEESPAPRPETALEDLYATYVEGTPAIHVGAPARMERPEQEAALH